MWSISRIFFIVFCTVLVFCSFCIDLTVARRQVPQGRSRPQNNEEEEPKYSGRFNAELGMAGMQNAFKDPKVLKEALDMYNDPEIMAEVQKMMSDPEFKRQMEKYTQSDLFKQSMEKAKEIAKDPKKLRQLQQEMTKLLNDPMMKDMLPPGFDLMDGMLDDPKFQRQLQDLLEDPSSLLGTNTGKNTGRGFKREL